jgi:hypothetical protein
VGKKIFIFFIKVSFYLLSDGRCAITGVPDSYTAHVIFLYDTKGLKQMPPVMNNKMK